MNAPAAHPPKYLVCVNRRNEARAALRLAAGKASARAGSLTLVHVVPPPDFQALGGLADRMHAEQRQEAEAHMQELSAEIQSLYGLIPVINLREGQVGEEILAAAAEDKDATMLVLGVGEHHAGAGKLTAWLASQLGTRLLIPLFLVPGSLTEAQLDALI